MAAQSQQTTEVARLLTQLRSGSRDAERRLFELVYTELRRIAAVRIKAERAEHTLSATALVHEAYLRMSGATETIENRTHFLLVAARAMRHILVDHARARRAGKRGGEVNRISLEEVNVAAAPSDVQLVGLNDALDRLAEISPRQSQVVELRYFAGLTEEQIAESLGVTRRTVNRDWAMARAWLYAQLNVTGGTSDDIEASADAGTQRNPR